MASASSSFSSQRLLPPFAIRDLNGSEAAPGIVQITADQYDDSIKDEPDDVLTYMDDDDGEVVTVGSALELEQRLDEPAKHSTVPVPTTLKTTSTSDTAEDRMMHIFDIRHENKKVSKWQDIQKSTRQTMKNFADRELGSTSSQAQVALYLDSILPQPPQAAFHAPEAESSSNTSSAHSEHAPQEPQIDQVTTSSAMSEHVTNSAMPTERKLSQPSELTSTELDRAMGEMFKDLGSHLGPVADFLESTARSLRRIAEKSANADASPVEDVLSGFKEILSDVGQLGLECLAASSHKTGDHEAKESIAAGPSASEASAERPSSSTPTPTTAEQEVPPKVETNAKRVSFVESSPRKPEQKRDLGKAPAAPTEYGFDSNALFCSPTAQTPNVFGWTQHGSLLPWAPSILDLEPSEPGFSARYPPLMSLRKARSVSGLHDKPQPSAVGQSGLNAASALTRYPSISQLEQQARLRARARFEEKSDRNGHAGGCTSASDSVLKPKKTDVYRKPHVEDELESEHPGKPDDSITTGNKGKSPMVPGNYVPGAWPEHKAERSSPVVAASKSSPPSTNFEAPQSSTASSRRQEPDCFPVRVNGPVSDMYPRAATSSLPRRYHTVTGTNPAARLNGPFDPLAPLAPHNTDNSARGRPTAYSSPWISSDDYRIRESTTPNPSRAASGQGQTIGNARKRTFPQAPDWSFSGPSTGTRPDESLHRTLSTSARYRLAAGQAPQLTSTRARNGDLFRPSFEDLTTRLPAIRPGTSLTGLGPTPLVKTHAHPSQSDLAFNTRPRTNLFGFEHVGSVSTSAASGNACPNPSLSPIITSTPYIRPAVRSDPVASPPTSTRAVDLCIKSLKAMGYGTMDQIEMSRLNMYASAAAGDVEVAIEMIEEDREAAKAFEDAKGSSEIAPPAGEGRIKVEEV